MRFLLTLAVWGDWHIDQLVRNALPSLRAPGNLDAVDYVISVHTRAREADRVMSALAGANIEIRAPIPENTGSAQAIANGAIHHCARLDFERASAAGEVWGLLAPDMVWSEGSFALYRRLIEGGNKAVFRPLLRVDSALAGTVREFGNRHLAKLALDCEHEMGRLYRADADGFTTHTEAIIWTAPDGRLHQTISADVVLCLARETGVTGQFLCAEEYNGRMAAVRDSDESVALAMTPPDKDYEWQSGGATPLSPTLIRAFLSAYPSAAWRGLGAQTYRLHAGDTDAARWVEVERRAIDFIESIVT